MGNYERIKRKENETLFDYYKRITDMRRDYDLDYSEWCEIVTGKQYSSENGRKMYYGIKAMFDNLEEDKKRSIEDEDLLNALEEKEIELRKERVKLTDMRTKFNKLVRESARREVNIQNIKDSIIELSELKPLNIRKEIEIIKGNEAVLNFSDFHLGLEVSNYFNEYNVDIAIKRIEKLIEKTIGHCKLHEVSKLHFVVNGDIINGFKHLSLVANADLSVARSITLAGEIISNMIGEFCNYLPKVEVYFATGNHAMMNKNKECLEGDNFEFLIFDFIKLRTDNLKNLTINENKYSDDIVSFEIGNKFIIATHGHKDNPKNCAERLSTFLDRKPDFVLLGHYHHFEEFDNNNVNVKVNGSIISTDEYAFGLRLNTRPYQLLVIHDKEGEEICTYKVRL